MAKHLIREVVVDPPVPADLIVFNRAEIQRFVDTARRTVADLEAQLDAARQPEMADVIDITDDRDDEPQAPYKSPLFSLPPWTARVGDDADNTTFFESLRDESEPLIAGA
jgi:hypothetical protein